MALRAPRSRQRGNPAAAAGTSQRAAARSARLFVALWPDAALRSALAMRRDALAWPAMARPTPDEKLHATLQFIGTVPAATLAALEAALDVRGPPAQVHFDQAELWPGGLVVLLARTVPPALRELHALLGEALRDLGLPVERRALCPHVTLARRCEAPVALPAFEPLRWPVRGWALVESAPAGSYRVIRRYEARL